MCHKLLKTIFLTQKTTKKTFKKKIGKCQEDERPYTLFPYSVAILAPKYISFDEPAVGLGGSQCQFLASSLKCSINNYLNNNFPFTRNSTWNIRTWMRKFASGSVVWFTAMPAVLFIFGYYDCKLRLFERFMFFMIFTSFLDFYGPFK